MSDFSDWKYGNAGYPNVTRKQIQVMNLMMQYDLCGLWSKERLGDLSNQISELEETNRVLCRELGEAQQVVERLRDQVSEMEQKNDTIEERLIRIQQWCEAYPLDMFPEPDNWTEIADTLRPLGSPNTLDCVSASTMRRVVNGIRKLAGVEDSSAVPDPTN